MFYTIVEQFILTTQDVPVWDYLGVRQDTWSRIKKTDKLSLDNFKKLCIAADYHITDNKEELAKRMVEVFPWH
jgi:hypothetical protein